MLRSTHNLAFNYEIEGNGRPIVILHGNGPDHRMMKGCMEPIFSKDDDWKRIYLDLPGMGKSVAEKWINTSDDMLKAVEIMIEELIPNEPYLLVGDSYGAYLARGLVKYHGNRIEGLYLLCPCIIADAKKRRIPSHSTVVEDKELLDRLDSNEREEFSSIAVVQNKYIWDRFNSEIMTGLNISNKQFMKNIKKNAYEFSFNLDDMDTFDKPTLVLTGRQDSFVGYKDAWDILDKYPRATFGVIDRAGHNLQIEQEEIFNVMTKEWLERVRNSINLRVIQRS